MIVKSKRITQQEKVGRCLPAGDIWSKNRQTNTITSNSNEQSIKRIFQHIYERNIIGQSEYYQQHLNLIITNINTKGKIKQLVSQQISK